MLCVGFLFWRKITSGQWNFRQILCLKLVSIVGSLTKWMPTSENAFVRSKFLLIIFATAAKRIGDWFEIRRKIDGQRSNYLHVCNLNFVLNVFYCKKINQMTYKFVISTFFLSLTFISRKMDAILNDMTEKVIFRYTSLGCFCCRG